MAKRDLHNNLKEVVAFKTQTVSSDTTTAGEIIDMQGFESLEIFCQMGTLTDGDYAFKLEYGDDSGLSDNAVVPSEQLLGDTNDGATGIAFTADTEDDTIKKVGYVGEKRYVRLSIVSTNTTSGAVLGATGVKGHASNNDVN